MDEMHRMGGQHETDLEREASRFPRAVAVRACSQSVLLVVAALAFVAAGCGSGGTAEASPSDDTADIVRAAERERLRALLGHDLDAARKVHADDFELINPLGEVVSKEAYLDSGAAFAYTVWKPRSPIRVRVYGDAAVIRYESDLEIHGNRGHDWHTDVYEKRDGRWQVVWSQTTAAP